MKFAYAFLAESAMFSPIDGLSVIGGERHRLEVGEFPHIAKRLSLIVKLKGGPEDIGKANRLTVSLLHETSAESLAEFGQLVYGPKGLPQSSSVAVAAAIVIFDLNGTRFPHPGYYGFDVAVDGVRADTVYFKLELKRSNTEHKKQLPVDAGN